ncbi:MAG: hypothetical protein LBH06_03875 [Rikenellaceae bacterium]|jgi:endonuclease/exonuclease/phosphatase family metal-dependent hydrolase|nr:hypothetical protein [Rikenellaceae bacterium]
MKRLVVILLLPLLQPIALAQGPQPVKLGFYNVENFYDTIPSLFRDDGDFTPQGRNRWNTERYLRKTANLARVLDDMSLDVVALAEVENEAVVRDLVTTLHTDYNYIYRTTGDFRGLDVALLYKGDKLYPGRVRQIELGSTREALYVRGELHGKRIDLIICHLPSKLNNKAYQRLAMTNIHNFADSLQRCDGEAHIVVMGDMNCDPRERPMRDIFGLNTALDDLFSPLLPEAQKGGGSYVYNSRRMMFDNIFLSRALFDLPGPIVCRSAGVFVRDYMLAAALSGMKTGYPLRTFVGTDYVGGFSDHLPVYVILEVIGRQRSLSK